MENLKIDAALIEEEIKIAKEKKEFNKITELHLKATDIYKKLSDLRNLQYHCANYYSAKGESYFFKNEYTKALKCLKTAENKFIEMNLMDPALHCSSKILRSIHSQAKKEGNIKSKYFQEFLEQSEIFLERYKDYPDNFNYLKAEIIYNGLRSRNYRIEGKLELAEVWSKKSYELAENAYKIIQSDSFKKDYIYNLKQYWELKAKRLEKEHKYIEASEYYKKAAVIISATNELESFNEYACYHKCIALANRHDHDIFTYNINSAIEYSVKRNDKAQINFFTGFKYQQTVKFSRNIDDKIDLLTKAKEHYFKANTSHTIHEGKYVEYLLFYYRSKKELSNGDYEKSIGLLEKAISYSNIVYFPNIVSSESILKKELLLHQFYLFISNGKFVEGSKLLKEWLECRQDIMGTSKYVFYDKLCTCCQKLGQDRYITEDLYDIHYLLLEIKEKKLSFTLYIIASLTYSYLSLHLSLDLEKIIIHNVFESIKLEIISKITTEEAANYVKESIEVQNALERQEWLYRIPPLFAEKFDDCIFLLNDITEGYHYVVFKEFYKIIENFLKVVVEFNAKLLWNDKFELVLKEKLDLNKNFNSFTFGDLYDALVVLRDNNADFCNDISDNLLELLKWHVENRNNLTHDYEFDDSIDILQDTTKLILGLLKSFPTIIKITDSRRKPWYDIEIQWNIFPRKISLYSVKDLQEGHNYYLEPMFEILDNRISPELIISK